MNFEVGFGRAHAARALAFVLVLSFAISLFPRPADAATVIYLTSGTSWTVPGDWNSTNNTIEVIGGGANGTSGASGNAPVNPCFGLGGPGSGGSGGGGGAYSKVTNLSLTPSASIAYAVGTAGGDTYLCNSTSNCSSISATAVQVGAKGASGSSGGSSSSGVGTIKVSGGSGAGPSGGNGGGGGGAGGLHGAGSSGSGSSGGSGDAGNTAAGANGTQYDGSHGSGGGGGGGGAGGEAQVGGSGSSGGLYGAGGGGGGGGGEYLEACYGSPPPAGGSGGSGRAGLIIITYTPITPPTTTFTKSVTATKSINVVGAVSKGSGSFVIDHPLDPKNKLLYHSFVESPEAVNIYDGIATLDKNGEAIIELPGYFTALNKDFTYLATPIGQPMPNLHLAKGVYQRFFGLLRRAAIKIAGGAPNGRVSWQVTGVRHDPLILAHPIIVEVLKGPGALFDKGQYQCQECYAH